MFPQTNDNVDVSFLNMTAAQTANHHVSDGMKGLSVSEFDTLGGDLQTIVMEGCRNESLELSDESRPYTTQDSISDGMEDSELSLSKVNGSHPIMEFDYTALANIIDYSAQSLEASVPTDGIRPDATISSNNHASSPVFTNIQETDELSTLGMTTMAEYTVNPSRSQIDSSLSIDSAAYTNQQPIRTFSEKFEARQISLCFFTNQSPSMCISATGRGIPSSHLRWRQHFPFAAIFSQWDRLNPSYLRAWVEIARSILLRADHSPLPVLSKETLCVLEQWLYYEGLMPLKNAVRCSGKVWPNYFSHYQTVDEWEKTPQLRFTSWSSDPLYNEWSAHEHPSYVMSVSRRRPASRPLSLESILEDVITARNRKLIRKPQLGHNMLLVLFYELGVTLSVVSREHEVTFCA